MEEEPLKFYPPLYKQRYKKTANIIEEFKLKMSVSKVVDIGCAELNFFNYIKNSKYINEVVLVDIDFELLESCVDKVKPLLYDYVHRRNNPLKVSILCADATLIHPLLINADVVTMIEFIEHLYEEQLPAVITNIFGVIKPSLVVITTPNADYNKYFPNFKGPFRHYDHKFEWTKQQFQGWSTNITETYPSYSVQFSGCGKGPDETFCSQIAIFFIKNQSKEKIKYEISSLPQRGNNTCCKGCLFPWKNQQYCNIVFSIDYPYDERTEEQKIKDNIRYLFFDLISWLRSGLREWNFDDGYVVFHKPPQLTEFDDNEEDESRLNDSLNLQKDESIVKDLINCQKVESESKDSLNIQKDELALSTSITNENLKQNEFRCIFLSNFIELSSYKEKLDVPNNFIYSELENAFIFNLLTFSTWGNIGATLDIILDVLNEVDGIKLIGTNSDKLILLKIDDDSENELESIMDKLKPHSLFSPQEPGD